MPLVFLLKLWWWHVFLINQHKFFQSYSSIDALPTCFFISQKSWRCEYSSPPPLLILEFASQWVVFYCSEKTYILAWSLLTTNDNICWGMMLEKSQSLFLSFYEMILLAYAHTKKFQHFLTKTSFITWRKSLLIWWTVSWVFDKQIWKNFFLMETSRHELQLLDKAKSWRVQKYSNFN